MNTSITPITTTIALKTQKGTLLINYNELLYLNACNKHTLIYLIDGQCVETNHLLKWYEDKLPRPLFCRCHNSFILNNLYVECINESQVFLNNQNIVPLSRKWKQLFLENFTWFKQQRIHIRVDYGLMGVK